MSADKSNLVDIKIGDVVRLDRQYESDRHWFYLNFTRAYEIEEFNEWNVKFKGVPGWTPRKFILEVERELPAKKVQYRDILEDYTLFGPETFDEGIAPEYVEVVDGDGQTLPAKSELYLMLRRVQSRYQRDIDYLIEKFL